jgi:uncharacterized protein
MVGKLTDKQIELVLHTQLIGRIGCYVSEKIYITPVTYVYHDGYIYAHSKDGQKVQTMRSNPRVCFQVDSVENMRNWRSVLLWGEYEELTSTANHQAGLKIMADRLTPFSLSETVSLANNFSQAPLIVEKGARPVVYRIRVTEKTGRYEKS